MKKHLISEKGNFYKANLHVHTDVSDGRLSPEVVKDGYKSHGYSVVAFTDHEVFVPQNELCDDEFIALNSVEISINENGHEGEFALKKTYHLNLYAKNQNQKECAVCTAKDVFFEASKKYISEFAKNNVLDKFHTVESMNDLINRANKDGFLVCYNHPVWSLHNHSDYSGLKGLWGVEVYNTGSYIAGYEDSSQPYEDLLRENTRVVPICADDAHNLKASAYGGWTMIKAESLTYDNIITALEKGDCYSSTGPEIKTLTFEDGIVNITTSNVRKIMLVTDIRYAKVKRNDDVDFINEASFDISDFIANATRENSNRKRQPYFRIEVTDVYGKRAYTRAYYLNELEN